MPIAAADVVPNGKILVKLVGLLIAAARVSLQISSERLDRLQKLRQVWFVEDRVVAASTGGFPLAANGDATIAANITLPAECQAPVILVRIFDPTAAANAQLGAFIALTGFQQITAPSHDDDSN